MKALKNNELCPIHKSRFCCGREKKAATFQKNATQHGPVTRITDEHTEKGYREVCTPAEMRRRKLLKLREQNGLCAHCGEKFTHMEQVELHHVRARGMGNAFRDDSLDNLIAVHSMVSEQSCHRKIHDGVKA